MAKDLRKMYREILEDHFPPRMEIRFGDGARGRTLSYEKVTWKIGEERKGLRYGENPDQEAALYRLAAGTLALGDIETIQPGLPLASEPELLQSGKHPSKTNITDVDSGLTILRYFADKPTAVIIKHNNPCGVARAGSLLEAYLRADAADRLAAFGGAIVLNRAADKGTAEAIAERYSEVVAAPEFEEGVLAIFARKPNIRVLRIRNMQDLERYDGEVVLEFRAMIDGGIVVQRSFVPRARSREDLELAHAVRGGKEYRIRREPTDAEVRDMLFGWLVESGVTSNSVIYVKDEATVGIGTGEQDRVGVAEIARDKAYRKLADRYAFEAHGIPYNDLRDAEKKRAIDERVAREKGGLIGAAMVSDAFFPFRDGVDVGLREGVKAVIQPGGSANDHQAIEACNEAGATMVFTGQRAFRH